MKLIPLTQGQFAKVDDEDYEMLIKVNWNLSCGYLSRTVGAGTFQGKQKFKKVLMHRLVMNAPDGMWVDHKDRDKLNNQKSNLRLCTPSQNSGNRGTRKGSTSQYLGVSFSKGKWLAMISSKKLKKSLGRFQLEEEAALAYNKAALEAYGEFANLNIIQ